MLVRKAELLVFMQKAASLTQADEALLDLIHPLAESALLSYMQQELQYQQYVEFLPIGRPRMVNTSPLPISDASLGDAEFRAATASYVVGQLGSEFLQLRNTPVALAGLQVKECVGGFAEQAEDSFGDDTVLTPGVDYWLDVDDPPGDLSKSGILYRNGTWPSEPRSIKVSYFGGWTAAHLAGNAAGAVKLAAMHTVSAAYWKAKSLAGSQGVGPYQSEGIGKYHYVLAAGSAASNMTFTVPADAKSLLQPFRSFGRIFG